VSEEEEEEENERRCVMEAAAASFLSMLSVVCLVLRNLRCCCICCAWRSISDVKTGIPRGCLSVVVVDVVVLVFVWPASSSLTELVEDVKGRELLHDNDANFQSST
jgi:hypothetical protein